MNEKASTRDLDDSEILDGDVDEGENEDEDADEDDVIEIRYILAFVLYCIVLSLFVFC